MLPSAPLCLVPTPRRPPRCTPLTPLFSRARGLETQVLAAQAVTQPFRNCVLRLSLSDETQIAAALEVVAVELGADVDIGSYPVSDMPDGAQILVTLESKSAEKLEAAVGRMRLLLPVGALLAEERDVRALSPPPPLAPSPPRASAGSGKGDSDR